MSEQPKTVKVRIAVAFSEDGYYEAWGFGSKSSSGLSFDHAPDFDLRQVVLDQLEVDRGNHDLHQIYFLTAELLMPQAQEVAATVEEVK